MTNKEKIIYFAGLVDGEGHMRVTPSKNGQGRPFLRAEISITQKDTALLDWLKENIGGNYWTQRPIMRLGAMRVWSRWSLTGRKAIEMARLIEPYLIVKKEQVKRLTRIEYNSRGWMDKATAYN